MAAPTSSGDYPVAKKRTVCRKGKGKMIISSSASLGHNVDPLRGGGSSGFSGLHCSATTGIVAVGDGVGPSRVILSSVADGTVVEKVSGPLMPYPDSSDSDASENYRPARLGALHFNAPPQIDDAAKKWT